MLSIVVLFDRKGFLNILHERFRFDGSLSGTKIIFGFQEYFQTNNRTKFDLAHDYLKFLLRTSYLRFRKTGKQ